MKSFLLIMFFVNFSACQVSKRSKLSSVKVNSVGVFEHIAEFEVENISNDSKGGEIPDSISLPLTVLDEKRINSVEILESKQVYFPKKVRRIIKHKIEQNFASSIEFCSAQVRKLIALIDNKKFDIYVENKSLVLESKLKFSAKLEFKLKLIEKKLNLKIVGYIGKLDINSYMITKDKNKLGLDGPEEILINFWHIEAKGKISSGVDLDNLVKDLKI